MAGEKVCAKYVVISNFLRTVIVTYQQNTKRSVLINTLLSNNYKQ